MTDTKLIRDFWAEQDVYRRGWLGKYQAPGIGVCTVRGEGRSAELFESRVEAEMAAARAKDRAEDRGRQPIPRSAKVFRPTGAGRNRRALAI